MFSWKELYNIPFALEGCAGDLGDLAVAESCCSGDFGSGRSGVFGISILAASHVFSCFRASSSVEEICRQNTIHSFFTQPLCVGLKNALTALSLTLKIPLQGMGLVLSQILNRACAYLSTADTERESAISSLGLVLKTTTSQSHEVPDRLCWTRRHCITSRLERTLCSFFLRGRFCSENTPHARS